MVRIVVHYAALALAIGSGFSMIWFGMAAQHYLDPDRPIGDWLTTTFTPSRRASDFVGPGWRYQKRQWLAAVCVVVALVLFGATG